MAVVTVKSKAITNRDASPSVLSDAAYAASSCKHFIGACAVASGDSIGSKYLVGSIPSNAIVASVLLTAPDIGTTTAADVGLYKVTADGGAVVDADFFSAAVSLKDGAIANSEVLHGNIVSLANSEKKVWELLGLTADPCISYDVVLTLTGAADASGSVKCRVQYAV